MLGLTTSGFRPTISGILKKLGLYRRLEWTPLHRWFVSFNNPSYDRAQNIEFEFYRRFVGSGSLVFDVGANVGSKSELFLRLGAQVVAVEPDLRCCQILRQRFPFQRRFHLAPKALGSSVGRLELFISEPGSAYNTLSRKWRDFTHTDSGTHMSVDVTTADALIGVFGTPQFIKIDVEGFEQDVLIGLSTTIQIISFEANLPLFRSETLSCIDRLIEINPEYRFYVRDDLTGYLGDKDSISGADARRIASERAQYCEIFAVITK